MADRRILVWAAWTSWSCASDTDTRTSTDDPAVVTDLPTVIATDTDPGDSGSPDSGDTGDTGTTGTGIVVDCAALPATPTSTRIMPSARAYHGLAFDAYGNLLGYANENVMSFDYYGNFQLYAPNIGSAEQFDMAPDGLLYVATWTGVKQVYPNGAQVTIGSFDGGYGLKVGPDGKIYVADNREMVRIDPVTGEQESFVPRGVAAPRVMDWSPDLTKMYFGNLSGGRVHVVDLDSNFDRVGPPRVLATLPGTSYHDGLSVDVCGNLYLPVYSDSAMYRISPSGQVTTLVDTSLQNYGHGLQFGSGIGGWRTDALYVPQSYNDDAVAEMVIGVYHRSWQGTVLNAP